jgi:Protein of unknown function (DUF3644)
VQQQKMGCGWNSQIAAPCDLPERMEHCMRLRNPEGALTDEEKPIVKALHAEGWRNQDIQALLNIGRDATINGARITEVKQNDKITPASARDVELFRAKKQAYDHKTGLNLFDDERLIRARESMLLAVQVFNSPTLAFKTEVFAVLANIAWTYLLHEYYARKGATVKDGDGWSVALSQMLERPDCPLSKGIKNNLASLKEIRDAVEHRLLGRTDHKWFSLFQACCLNFDKTICEMFGNELTLQKDLAFALQFARLSLDQIAVTQSFEIPDHVAALDARLNKRLTEDEASDLEYQFRVVYTLIAGTKGKSHIQFVHPGSKEAEQIRNVLVKYKTADELYPHKPSKVVQIVAQKSGQQFTGHMHTQAWRKYRARPAHRSPQPENTNKDYCVYHPAHVDYTYSDKWVTFLVKMLSEPDEYKALKAWK